MTQVQELLQSIQATQPSGLKKAQAEEAENKINFGDTVREFLQTVSEKSKTASGEVSDVIEGRSENLAGAMIAAEESKLSFQLMLEIRNKLLESYQEIQRMQV